MPVHLYGHPADHGPAAGEWPTGTACRSSRTRPRRTRASYDGTPVGSFGDFAMFSLYPTKNMTSGEGGMVACCRPTSSARRIRLLRNQGMERQYENEVVGLNNRMTDIHAAIGRVQLTKLAGWTAQRQANAAYLDAHLESVVTPPVAEARRTSTTSTRCGCRTTATASPRRCARSTASGTGVYYPMPNHRLPSFALKLDLPETERAAREVMSLPVHPALSDADLEHIVRSVNAVTSAGA